MTTRNTSRHPGTKRNFNSVAEFLGASFTDGYFTINYNGNPLDVLVEPVEGATTTLVSIHPAVTNPNVTRPYFIGGTLYGSLPVNRVYLSDPSLELDDDLTLGWFAGNQTQPDTQDVITSVISHTHKSLGSPNLVFIGASGGGFASMLFSSRFPDSLAIAINPQTDILQYTKYLVMRYAKTAWNAHTWGKAEQVLRQRTISNVASIYATETPNSVFYLQNITDRTHVEKQLQPFLKTMHPTNDVSVLLGRDWDKGHKPPPRELQLELLEEVVAAGGDWASVADAFTGLVPALGVASSDLFE